METRLSNYGLEPVDPYIPNAFKRLLRSLEFGCLVRRWEEGPHERKLSHITRIFKTPVLVMSGADDKVVPWEACEPVIRKLQEVIGENGSMKVSIHEGVGHKFSNSMKEEFRSWLVHLLDVREERRSRG